MQIEHECPQCGGPVVLDETDKQLSCGFCKVRLFIHATENLRYCIRPSDPFLKDVLYIPYWRFTGMHLLCKTSGIQNGLVDKTFLAIEARGLPSSLGLRTQSLKLRFARGGPGMHHLKPAIPFDRSLAAAGNTVEYELVRTQATRVVRISEDDYDMVPDVRLEIKEDRIFHEAFISDTVSTIYAPYHIQNGKVHDSVTNDVLGVSPDTLLNADEEKADWQVSFLPTTCPNCGWDTISGRDSSLVFCRKCATAWQVGQKGLTPTVFATMSSKVSLPAPRLYLPFWRISVIASGLVLDSYADFIKFTNIPRVPKPDWNNRPFYFWFPAFKTAPSVFLRIARQMTVADPEETDNVLPDAPIVPVNLPLDDAFDSAKTVIADLTLKKKTFFPMLEKITMEMREALLILVPFTDSGSELIQPDMNFSLFKNALRLGQII